MKNFARALALAFFCLFMTSPVWAAVETQNLIRNGDFEEAGTTPPGWKIDISGGGACALTTNAVTGKNALQFSLPASGNVTVSGDAVPVSAGADYVVTYWGRAEGHKDGGTLSANIVWQDDQGKQLAATPINSFSPPVPDYGAVTTTVSAPAGAVNAFLRYSAGGGPGGPAVFTIDQVRLMKLSEISRPADAQKWDYVNRTAASGLDFVADPNAAEGKALVAKAGKAPLNSYLAFGPYTLEQPVGEYLALFHLKVKDNSGNKPVVWLDVNGFGAFNAALVGRTILASDFKQPGVYQDIALRFVRPEQGALEFRVSYLGGTDLSYDKVTIVKLSDFATDKEQAAIWLGGQAFAVSPAIPAGKRDAVLVLSGLGHQTYFPTQALPQTLKFQHTYLAELQTGSTMDEPFPKKLDDLKGVGLVVLADIPAEALGGLMGRSTLRQFVEQGGGLLVFGGPFALGKGGYADSVLAPVLPITTMGPWDMVRAQSPHLQVGTALPITANLPWDQDPVMLYYQKTTANPGTQTLLECDGFPMAVTGRFGKGRVAVFPGTYLGEPAQGSTLFYEWPGYPQLLTRVVQWLVPVPGSN